MDEQKMIKQALKESQVQKSSFEEEEEEEVKIWDDGSIFSPISNPV